MKTLSTAPYLTQQVCWPSEGHYILAHYDADRVVVYQAFKPTIGSFAAKHGYFGGGFRFDRTSWIKTNFLWMMYRSNWGTAPQQTVVLAVSIRREAFQWMLQQAVHSKYYPHLHESDSIWYTTLKRSPVVLQWDPDHTPEGHKLPRRAIQLGLRGEALERYAQEWILNIEDISEFVAEQRRSLKAHSYDLLTIPEEKIYPVDDSQLATRLLLNTTI